MYPSSFLTVHRLAMPLNFVSSAAFGTFGIKPAEHCAQSGSKSNVRQRASKFRQSASRARCGRPRNISAVIPSGDPLPGRSFLSALAQRSKWNVLSLARSEFNQSCMISARRSAASCCLSSSSLYNCSKCLVSLSLGSAFPHILAQFTCVVARGPGGARPLAAAFSISSS